MGRNLKKGLDYFSHDVDYDTQLEVVISITGEKGHGIINRIWQHIYKTEGYYMPFNEDEVFIIQRKCSDATITEINNVITEMVKRNLFCKHKYDNHNILTSKRLQQNYIEATKRRKDVDINTDYVLIDVDILLTKSTQRKEEESKSNHTKSKKSKVNESKVDEIKAAADFIAVEWNRLLTSAEVVDLRNIFKDINPTMREIEDAVLITIQRKITSIKYLEGILKKERDGYIRLDPPDLMETLGKG